MKLDQFFLSPQLMCKSVHEFHLNKRRQRHFLLAELSKVNEELSIVINSMCVLQKLLCSSICKCVLISFDYYLAVFQICFRKCVQGKDLILPLANIGFVFTHHYNVLIFIIRPNYECRHSVNQVKSPGFFIIHGILLVQLTVQLVLPTEH